MRFVLVLLGLVFWSGEVGAGWEWVRVACGEGGALQESLKGEWKEEPVGVGIDQKGNLVQLWVSEGGKTWTLVFTTTSGKTCIFDIGKDWEMLEGIERGTSL